MNWRKFKDEQPKLKQVSVEHDVDDGEDSCDYVVYESDEVIVKTSAGDKAFARFMNTVIPQHPEDPDDNMWVIRINKEEITIAANENDLWCYADEI